MSVWSRARPRGALLCHGLLTDSKSARAFTGGTRGRFAGSIREIIPGPSYLRRGRVVGVVRESWALSFYGTFRVPTSKVPGLLHHLK